MSLHLPQFFSILWNKIREGFVGLRDNLLKTLIFWFLLIGGISALLFILQPGFVAAKPFPKLFELLATVLLTGGVFEGIVKSMQYSEVFKTELVKLFDDPDFVRKQQVFVRQTVGSPESSEWLGKLITDSVVLDRQKAMISQVVSDSGFLNQHNMLLRLMYKPEVLEKRKDLEEIWRTVSRLVYQNTFPDISELIADRVLTEYFPKADNFYYEDFVEYMDISSFGDDKHIVVASKLNFTIKAMDTSQKVTWNYVNEFMKEPSDDVAQYRLDQLTVNGSDKLKACPSKAEPMDEGRMLRLTLSLGLGNSKDYKVRMVERKVYDPRVPGNGIKDFTSTRFINRLELYVNYPDNLLDVVHSPVGTGPGGNLTPKTGGVSYIYNGLIFPHQGYRLVLRRR